MITVIFAFQDLIVIRIRLSNNSLIIVKTQMIPLTLPSPSRGEGIVADPSPLRGEVRRG
jgi:hypothetical protein